MSVLIETSTALPSQVPQQKSPGRNCRKMSSETRKKTSVVRRTKKNINNSTFRHSLHEISNGMNGMTLKEETNDQPTERVRLKRSRSFHVTEEHIHIHQKDRSEILKQYVANCFAIDVDDLDTEDNENFANIKYDPTDGTFPLHEAIEKHNIKEIAVYLWKNENINIEQTNNFGQTPLIFAVSLGLVDVVKLLIACGASVNSKDNYGVSALRYAVESADFEMASLLISNGANAAAVQNGF